MPAKLTPEEWKKVGEQYVTNIPVLRISKQFGVARISIERAAKRFGWVKIPRGDIQEVVQAKVHGVHISTDPQAKAEFIEKVADERAKLVGRHQKDWSKVYSLRADAYAILSGQKTKVVTDVKKTEGGATEHSHEIDLDLKNRIHLAGKLLAMFEADARALSTAQEGERRANGFDYKAQKVTDTRDEGEERERRRLIASLVEMANTFGVMAPQKQVENS